MQQNNDTSLEFRGRISKLQAAMREFGMQAVVLEPGTAMLYLTGVRWGKSERTFALVLPVRGEPVWVLPGFEEMRARELIHVGDDIRVWQEDESPYARIVQALKDRGVTAGRVGIDEGARFFVFDGIRQLAPKLDYISATQVLKNAGVDLSAGARGGRKQ
ncbi:MAG TPA: aminopeptidase P family N-terminal domain-containing protein [Verrucomicrobiae bacterium]|nr:aminopeptidase P family N-terminal domain-containing protein [Verrucomicrobiae bacterium]